MGDGWTSRLRLGIARAFAGGNDSISNTVQHRSSSNIDVNAIKYAMDVGGQGGFSQPVWGQKYQL